MRGIIAYTTFSSPRASRLCRMHLCDHNLMFIVKCIIKEYPIRAVGILFVYMLLIFGNCIKLAQTSLSRVEYPTSVDFTNYLNCFWCIIVTMGTIGYGDYYPRTIPGRLTIFFASIAGVLLTSLLVVALTAYLNMSIEQQKAHVCAKRLRLQDIVNK